jgi:hypothetical protein
MTDTRTTIPVARQVRESEVKMVAVNLKKPKCKRVPKRSVKKLP